MLPQLSRAFRRMHLLNNLLSRDLERNLARSFQTFDMLEGRNTTPRVDENTYYRMNYTVDNNGHVKVKTIEKEPGKEWNTQVKEYDRRGNMDAIQQEQPKQKVEAIEGKEKQADANTRLNTVESGTKASENPMTKENKSQSRELSQRGRSNFDEIDAIFENINRDFEASVRRAFGMFDPFYHPEEFNSRRSDVKAFEQEKPTKANESVQSEKTDNGARLNTAEAKAKETAETNTETTNMKDETSRTPKEEKAENSNEVMNKRNDHELSRRYASGFDEIDAIFDNMNREFEHNVRRTFDMFDPFGYRTWFDPFNYRVEFNPEHTVYNMRSVVNENGNVRVKTVRKEPGKDWDVKVEEYNSEKKGIEQDKLASKKEDASIGEEKSNNAQIAN